MCVMLCFFSNPSTFIEYQKNKRKETFQVNRFFNRYTVSL